MNTGNSSIELLFNKYLQGDLSPFEKKQFYDLISDSENESEIKEILFKNISEYQEDPPYFNKPVDFESIYGNILYEIKQNEIKAGEEIDYRVRSRVRKITIYSSLIAAVFIFAFFLGRILPSRETPPVQTKIVSYTEIKAPYGSKSEIRLPDGTLVILNAGSVLKYSNEFNTDNRDISLVGEAYFKVAKNEKIPLIVNAGTINIRAVGTEFNIKAYDEEGTIETTLIEGKVEITSEGKDDSQDQFVDLVPNQKAIFIKNEESFILEKLKTRDSVLVRPVQAVNNKFLISPKVNVNQIVAWTEGKLILRGENLENLCVELERKYDVKFIFSDEEIKKYRFTGVLLDETLEQVLNVIKLTAPIHYTLERKNVYMSSDRENINKYSDHLK